MIYIVLGMHKSGTTLVSTILHKSGINMGETFADGTYDTGNQYEREEMYQINLELLGTDNDQTLKLKPPNLTDIKSPQKEKIKQLIIDCEKRYVGEDWGMKDPRTSLTYSIWEEQLPEHKIIGVFRSPEEIWPRYRWKGWRRRYINFFWAWHFLNRWYEHNKELVNQASFGQHEIIIINYTEFMDKKSAIKPLSQFVNRPLVDERRETMYRSRNGYDLPLWIAKAMIRIFKGRSIDHLLSELKTLSIKS